MTIYRTPHPAVVEIGDNLGNILARCDISNFSVQPRPGSPCRLEERQLPPSSRPGADGSILVHADMASQFRLLVATDCMKGIVSLIKSGTSLYSVFSLARTAMEAFAYAAWLLEPEISAEQRAYRGILDHRASTKKLLNNLHRKTGTEPINSNLAAKLGESIALVEENLKHIKNDLEKARSLIPNTHQESYPTAGRVIGDAINTTAVTDGVGTGQYGYLSGVVHSGVGRFVGVANIRRSVGLFQYQSRPLSAAHCYGSTCHEAQP